MSTMESNTQIVSNPQARILAEIESLGLETYRETLDEQGFVVVPPEIASPDNLAGRLLEAVLDVAERRSGVRPDLEGGSTHEGFQGRVAEVDGDSPWGEMVKSLIHEGRVFEEGIMNPVFLAMTTYLCGYSMVMSSYAALLKGPNRSNFHFHTDTLLPPPWPRHAFVCNGTYLLTDFDRESGATAFMPGSHKWGRAPMGDEALVGEGGNPDAVVVEAPAGSLLVWHGCTWHGAFRRTRAGLRVSIPILMARSYMRTEEDLNGNISQEILDRNNTRFAILMQQGVTYGWSSNADAEKRLDRSYEYLAKYHEEMAGAAVVNPMAYGDDLIYG